MLLNFCLFLAVLFSSIQRCLYPLQSETLGHVPVLSAVRYPELGLLRSGRLEQVRGQAGIGSPA